MILAHFNQLAPFKKLSKNLQTAIEYLETTDLQSMKDGRYEIAGEDVYVLVTSYETYDPKEREYETHNQYLDIQCLIGGQETAYYAQKPNLTPSGDYIPEKDKQNFTGKEEACFTLRYGIAAIFFPEDAHKVCCFFGNGPQAVRKLLIKVKIA